MAIPKQIAPFRIRFEPESGNWSLFIPSLGIYKLVDNFDQAESQSKLMFDIGKGVKYIIPEANNTDLIKWYVFYDYTPNNKKD